VAVVAEQGLHVLPSGGDVVQLVAEQDVVEVPRAVEQEEILARMKWERFEEPASV
jgi:hypothetical protein